MSYNLGHVVGADGKGIVSIEKTDTSGLVDTYTITYTDDTTSTFEVTNGRDGSGGSDIVTAWETVLSDEKIPSEKLTKNTIDTKANATHTHGNIDNTGILKISGTAQASKNVVTDGTGKITVEAKPDLTNYLQKSQTSGLVKNDGSIDTSAYITNSALSNYLQKSQTSGLVKNDGSIDTTTYSATGHSHSISDVTNLQSSLNGKASTSHTHDDRYYTETETDTLLNAKADTSHTHQKSDISDFSHTHSISDVTNLQTSLDGKVNTSDIANNLTTTTAGKVLDARQGKALADLIGDAIDYINL